MNYPHSLAFRTCLILAALAIVALGPLSACHAQAPDEQPKREAEAFREIHAGHFRPLDDIHAILVTLSYDETLLNWLDKQEMQGLTIEAVKAKFPPQLRDRVVLADEGKTYPGLNVHLDFYALSSPARNYPGAKRTYIALATLVLASYETIEGDNTFSISHRTAGGHVRPIRRHKHFGERYIREQINLLLQEYLARLDACISEKTYESCVINDLGYSDINRLQGVEMGPG